MLRSYLPAIVFLMLGGAVGGAFAVLNSTIGPRRARPHKQDPYECGLPSEVKRGMRFGISFYLIAMLFILFDIEVVFLYPIAIELRAYGSLRAGRDDRRSSCCCSWRSCTCGAGGRLSGGETRGRYVRRA